MQRIKRYTSPSVFSSCFKLLTIGMKPDFLNTILKEQDGFSKYVKFLINYQGRKLENYCLTTEKKLVTSIFFEQRIKGKLNTRFD